MTQQEVIKTFMQSLKNTELSGRAALDEAVQASSEFKSYHELINQFMDDITAAGNWYRFLAEKCGIILDNADTGAITGADAGGTLKTATDILPAKGKAQYPEGTSFTVKGLTIYGIPPKEQLTSDQQYVIQGLYSWWLKDALTLIEESYGLTYDTANNARLKMKFIDDPDSGVLAYVQYDDASINMQKFEGRVLCVNMHYFQNMKKSDRHGTTDTFNLDRTLVHELVHGLMAPNINYFSDLPGALKEGGTAELIHGIDDERSYAIMKMAQNPERFRNIVMASDTSAPIEAYAGGYMLMRYYAKQAGNNTFAYDTYSARVKIDDTNFATNYWDTVTMSGGSDSDTLANSGANVSINAGAGDDVIKNYVGNKVTVKAGAGNDEVLNDGGWNVSISGGSGNDEITSNGQKVTIEGGTGSDEITNSGAKSYVDGGNGNDYIRNNVTGYDTLAVANAVIQEGALFAEENMVMVGVGNSTIQAFSADLIGGTSSTLIGGDGEDLITNYAGKVQIYGGDGIDAIENYGYGSKVYGDAGDDIITNGNATVEVSMPAGTTGTATVTGDGAKIYGGDGNDSITNTADSVKLYGQNGADSITNEGIAASIYGGADNDNVINAGEKAYINLGDGDDFLENQSVLVKAVGGDGNDLILNGGDNNSLYGGAGNDHIINYGDENNFLSGDSGNDTLYSSGANATLDGGSGNDNFYNEGVNVSISGGAGNDTLYNEGDHIIMAGGAGNDYIVNNGGEDVTISGGTGNDSINGGDGNDKLFGQNGNDSIGGGEGADSLNGGDGSDKLFGGAENDSILGGNGEDSISGDAGDDKLFGNAGNDSITGGKGADTLSGDTGDDKLVGDAGNDSLNGGNGEDTLTGGSGNDILIGGKGNDIFIYSAGNDTVTDYAAGDKISLGAAISKTTLNDSDVVFTIGKGSLTIQKAKGKTLSLINSKGKEYSTLVSDSFTVTNSTKSPAIIESFVKTVDASSRTKVIAITGNALANTISGGTKNDSIYGAAGNDSILGNAGNDKLYGDAGNDILLGGKDNDSLWGGAGNDTLTGNDGNDIFIYESGKDFITDYTAGQDKIQIASGKISKTSLSGSDVLFTIGKGSLTVKNAKGKTISLLDSAGKASSTVVGAQALTNSNKANVTIGADMGFVDSSKRTKAISIKGNALANTISGGTKNDSIFGAGGNDSILGNAGNDKLYGDAGNDILLGGKGNDSLWGGAGNDSLWGDASNDTFIYTVNEGTDKIFDYADGDMLKILNADGSDGYFKSSKYSGGDLTLTINGGGKIIFDDVASTTKFNINGLFYQISGSKLVKK